MYKNTSGVTTIKWGSLFAQENDNFRPHAPLFSAFLFGMLILDAIIDSYIDKAIIGFNHAIIGINEAI